MDMDLERLKMYAQALRSNIHHLLSTLTPVDGLKGLETIKNPEKVKDCEQADGSAHILDLEEAANAEELCKAREERAEMKVCVCGVCVGCVWWGCGVCVGLYSVFACTCTCLHVCVYVCVCVYIFVVVCCNCINPVLVLSVLHCLVQH